MTNGKLGISKMRISFLFLDQWKGWTCSFDSVHLWTLFLWSKSLVRVGVRVRVTVRVSVRVGIRVRVRVRVRVSDTIMTPTRR